MTGVQTCALPIFLLMINVNPNLIWVVVKHAVFKDTLPSDAWCFGLSLSNNPQHLVLKALRDIAPPRLGNQEPIMLFSTTTLLLLGCWIVEHLTMLRLTWVISLFIARIKDLMISYRWWISPSHHTYRFYHHTYFLSHLYFTKRHLCPFHAKELNFNLSILH